MKASDIKAVVLLGYRNAGKDSVCKGLQERYTNIWNAKFGAYNKELVASFLKIPVSLFEDKDYRNRPWFDDFTPLDLLNAVFLFSNTNERLQQKIDDHCLDSIPKGYLPVFTDVRRQRELEQVFNKYGEAHTVVFNLDPACAEESEGDEELDELVESCTIERYLLGSLSANTDAVAKVLCLNNKYKKKPTLHLVKAPNTIFIKTLDVYEPLTPLVDKCEEFAEALDLENSQYLKVRLFNLIYSEIDLSNFEIADVLNDSYMVYDPSHHERFLDKLRKKANIKLHCSQADAFKSWVQDTFTKEEIVTHE